MTTTDDVIEYVTATIGSQLFGLPISRVQGDKLPARSAGLRPGISGSGSCEGAVPGAGAPVAVSCALGDTDIRNLPRSIPGHVSSSEKTNPGRDRSVP